MHSDKKTKGTLMDQLKLNLMLNKIKGIFNVTEINGIAESTGFCRRYREGSPNCVTQFSQLNLKSAFKVDIQL